MITRKLNSILVLLLLSLSLSCSLEATRELGIWSSLEGNGFGQASLVVRLEDSRGLVPTAARVQVRYPDGRLSWIPYVAENGYFHSLLDAPGNGEYTIEAQTLGKTARQTIPFTRLTDPPSITLVQDVLANSGGSSPDGSLPILVQWTEVPSASDYLIYIRKGGILVYSQAVDENSLLLSEGILESGSSYRLSVQAQSISGDPFLRTESYYSFDSILGGEYLVRTQP